MKYILLFLPSLILIILGICIKYFKAYGLISGYNTMSAEKKKNVDTEGLGKAVGNFCFVLSFLIFLFILFLIFNLAYPAIVVFSLFLFSILFSIIRFQKYDKNSLKEDGTFKAKTKVIIGSLIAFFCVIFIGVGIMLWFSVQPTTVDIKSDHLKINGLYGQSIPYNEIKEIKLYDNLPEVTFRKNGSSIGNKLKGYFKLKDVGTAKLFVNTEIPLFIYIKTDKIIFLNQTDKEETVSLFEKIKAKL